MSAYMVNREHIDALVQLALEGPTDLTVAPHAWDRPFRYYARRPNRLMSSRQFSEIRIEVQPENANIIGQMLAAENARSLRYRYEDSQPEEMVAEWADSGYTFSRHRRRLSPAEGLLAINGYEYQACEHPDWHESEAAQFCDALRNALVRSLPGYQQARTWSVGPEHLDRLPA